MPVWHAATKAWRESGELQVVGITQEQHPARARLFAQWQGIDWPILWDPFNLSGSKVVPRFTAVDEHGVVRSRRPRTDSFEAEFLRVDFPAPAGGPLEAAAGVELVELAHADAGGPEHAHYSAMADLLWRGPERLDAGVAMLLARAGEHPDEGAASFRAGVSLRMRHDSPLRRAGDFQAALSHWERALQLDPNQYIWRRRIQQWGPRLDKPYPFYDWVETARREVAARGEQPVALAAPLSGAEVARPARALESSGEEREPDPEGRIDRAPEGWFEVDSAVAFDTRRPEPVARVHLLFRPATDGAYWNNEAEAMRVWIAGSELPGEWRADRRLLEHAPPPQATSREERAFELELALPAGPGDALLLDGYALFGACARESGECRWVRRDFAVELVVPPVRKGR